MRVVHSLEEIPRMQSLVALTIGTFDGVHLGHQSLLQELKKHPIGVVLTFSNHPSLILRPSDPCVMIDSLTERLRLLEYHGVDLTIVLPFTHDLAATSYADFLRHVYSVLPFSHLVLGHGARIGKDGEGDEMAIHKLSKEISFIPVYLPKLLFEGAPVSSRRIRQLREEGDSETLQQLLGRST